MASRDTSHDKKRCFLIRHIHVYRNCTSLVDGVTEGGQLDVDVLRGEPVIAFDGRRRLGAVVQVDAHHKFFLCRDHSAEINNNFHFLLHFISFQIQRSESNVLRSCGEILFSSDGERKGKKSDRWIARLDFDSSNELTAILSPSSPLPSTSLSEWTRLNLSRLISSFRFVSFVRLFENECTFIIDWRSQRTYRVSQPAWKKNRCHSDFKTMSEIYSGQTLRVVCSALFSPPTEWGWQKN